MSTEIMIAAQFCMFLLLALIFMMIFISRLRKNNRQLRSAFDKLKDDLNGVSISTHLEEIEQQTLASSKRDNPSYHPELPPIDQAIALRVSALGAELSVLELMQRGKVKIEKGLAPYLAIAEQITGHITKVREDLKNQISADFQQRIAELQRQVEALQRKYKPMEDNYKKVQLLMDIFEYEDQDKRTRDEMEQMLHNALGKACEGFKDATLVREIVYLYHEAFFDRRNGGPAGAPAQVAGSGIGLYTMEHFEKLQSIVDEQYTMIGQLQTRLGELQADDQRDDIEHRAIMLEDRINDARHCLEMLGSELKKADELGGGYNSPEIMQVIDQFTEESAQMVERIHMLSNQNKMLASENEQLRVRLETEGLSEDNSMVLGLKAKLKAQADELLQLQYSYRDMEEKYLAHYEGRARM